MIRTTQALDSRRQGAGTRFTAILEADLVNPDGEVIAAAGATVYGQLAAAIGLGASLLSQGNQIVIPSGTILDFQMANHLAR